MSTRFGPYGTPGGGSVVSGVLQIASGVALDTTLRAVTDQAGTASPLQLSTTLAAFTTAINVGGTFANNARLHVRGDGTNTIARFENSSGIQMLGISNSVITIAREGNVGYALFPFNTDDTLPDILGFGLTFSSNKVNFAGNNFDLVFQGQNYTTTTGTANHITIKRTFTAAAGSANFRPLNIAYTINNSGVQSGTATGIFLNATQSNLNGMTHNLLDLQVNSSSFFRVTNNGTIFSGGAIYNNSGQFGRVGFGFINFYVNGNALLQNASENDFNRLQLGGTTNLFPAIKRNSSGIDFRLADDSAFCNIQAAVGSFTGFNSSAFTNNFVYGSNANIKQKLVIEDGNPTAITASALVEMKSTTLGFLPPRMTTIQKNAISTPANGLVVFDTDLGKLCVYSTTWQTVTSV